MSRKKKIWNTVLTVLLWGTVWQIAAMCIGSRIFLPSPFDALKSLKMLLWSAEFYQSTFFSLGNVARGFLLGVFFGTLLAACASKSEFLCTLLSLPMRVIKATPVASFTILALLWIDSKQLSVLVSFLMVLPVIYTNVLTGIQETGKELLEMAKVFRIRPYQKMRYIYAPNVLPYLISACTVATGLAWKSGIAAEVIGITKNSIGNNLYQAKIYLEMPELFAWTLVTIIISVLSERVVVFLLHLLEQSLLGRERMAKTVAVQRKETLGGTVAYQAEGRKISNRILLSDVTKSYDGQAVLTNVSLTLSKEQPVAVMGSSGIGKTTLLRLVLGMEQPDSGSIERETDRFAVVFQEHRLCDEISVKRNLSMICRSRQQKAEIPLLLERMGLKECAAQKVSSLSGGMKRRVAIGRALLFDAPVLLLDEPFQGLDSETKQSVMQLVKEKMTGKTVLLVTHDKAEAEFLGCEIKQL